MFIDSKSVAFSFDRIAEFLLRDENQTIEESKTEVVKLQFTKEAFEVFQSLKHDDAKKCSQKILDSKFKNHSKEIE